MGQQVNVYKKLKMFPGAIVEGSWNGSFDTGGTTYYVNNITGSSTADGLSWNSCVDQLSTAVTLSEASRLIHPGTTTNDYIRNTIVIQGTGTAYDSVTDIGEYVNIIGLGTPSNGRGYLASPRLGADSGETTGGFENTSSTTAGVYVANMCFQTGDASAAVDAGNINLSAFEDCTFMEATASAVPAAFFRINLGANGLTLRRCHTGGNAAITDRPSYGIHIDDSVFVHSLVEDCHFGGITAGFYVGGGFRYGFGSVVKNNLFGDMGHGVMLYGIYDMCPSTLGVSGLITYVHNFIQATHPMKLAGTYERAIMNYCDNVVVTADL